MGWVECKVHNNPIGPKLPQKDQVQSDDADPAGKNDGNQSAPRLARAGLRLWAGNGESASCSYLRLAAGASRFRIRTSSSLREACPQGGGPCMEMPPQRGVPITLDSSSPGLKQEYG
ncbi:hypothetical protein GX51_00251 [Blastomyces parvus]|uniref:Uncharacterized protein n=1 Tax=Blastomyces parvus TaxID=2060905 RepID=A0A2B7XM08_9EURO|nr:hypothetical protein GX51_00251 [Blastomyces parvus]